MRILFLLLISWIALLARAPPFSASLATPFLKSPKDSKWTEALTSSVPPQHASAIKLASSSQILQTFILTLDGILHALDPDSGVELWHFDTGSPVLSVKSNKRESSSSSFGIDFDSRDFLFQKYPGKSLMQKSSWSEEIGRVSVKYLVANSPLQQDDKVLLGSKRSTVFTLNSQTGQRLKEEELNLSEQAAAIDYILPGTLTLIRNDDLIEVRDGASTLYEASLASLYLLPSRSEQHYFSIIDFNLESNQFLLRSSLNEAELASRLWKGSLIVGAYNLIDLKHETLQDPNALQLQQSPFSFIEKYIVDAVIPQEDVSNIETNIQKNLQLLQPEKYAKDYEEVKSEEMESDNSSLLGSLSQQQKLFLSIIGILLGLIVLMILAFYTFWRYSERKRQEHQQRLKEREQEIKKKDFEIMKRDQEEKIRRETLESLCESPSTTPNYNSAPLSHPTLFLDFDGENPFLLPHSVSADQDEATSWKMSPKIQESLLYERAFNEPTSDVKKAYCMSPPQPAKEANLLTFRSYLAHKHTLSAKVPRKSSTVFDYSGNMESILTPRYKPPSTDSEKSDQASQQSFHEIESCMALTPYTCRQPVYLLDTESPPDFQKEILKQSELQIPEEHEKLSKTTVQIEYDQDKKRKITNIREQIHYDGEAAEVDQEFKRVKNTFLKTLQKSSESNKSTKPSSSPYDERENKVSRVGFQMEKKKSEDNEEISFKLIEGSPQHDHRKSKLEAIVFPMSPKPGLDQSLNEEEVKKKPAHVERFLENGKLQKFLNIEYISRGGFGAVYKATHFDGSDYAIKVVHLRLRRDQDIREHRIFREVTAMTRMKVLSQYIVRYFTSWLEESIPRQKKEKKNPKKSR